MSPSRQLLETVNFAFMKFFDSLVKIAVFRALSFFWRFPSCISSRITCSFAAVKHDVNLPKKGKSYFGQQIKNFHKSKIDGLQKLSTKAPQFYDFLLFNLNCKISFNLSVEVAIFLVFHNPFMMLFHILMFVSDHELMLDNFLITSSVICILKSSKLFSIYKN